MLVVSWNRNENWFIESTADQFHLARAHQGSKALKIFRVAFLNPEKERAGVVNGNANTGVFLDQTEEGFVGIPITLLKNVFEIARRLVCMNNEN